MDDILVVNGHNYGRAVKDLGYLETDLDLFFDDPASFKLILFTGGSDISPEYYGESSPSACITDPIRDIEEIKVFKKAQEYGIRCIGICRGVQLLNVLAGGWLYHHVTNHSGVRHSMVTSQNDCFDINSLHHQMLIPAMNSHVIGWAGEALSSEYRGDYDLLVSGPGNNKEPEAMLFPNINSAGVQYHPEIMARNSKGYKYFYDLAKTLMEEDDFNKIINIYSTDKPCQINSIKN